MSTQNSNKAILFIIRKRKEVSFLRQIILASHGTLSIGMADSIAMIMGDVTKDIRTFALKIGENPNDFKEQIEKEIKVHQQNEYIFVCDIKGGSVFNSLSQLAIYSNVIVYSGMNMNMILEILLSRSSFLIEENSHRIMDIGKQGIDCVTHVEFDEEDESF